MGVACEADTLEAVFLRRLVQVRLMRADEAEGRTRYELIHEFLVPPIAQWITIDEHERLMALEVVARAYEGYRQTGVLLEPQALAWLAQFPGLVLPSEHQAFVARSQQQRRRQRQRFVLTVGTGFLAVALGVSGLWGWRLYQTNQQLQATNVQLAEEEETAQTQRQNAEEAARGAEAQTRRANVYLAEVLVEKGIAFLAQGRLLHSYIFGAKALLLDPTSVRARSLAYISAVSTPYLLARVLPGPAGYRLAFSPDGQTLAAVAHRTIQLWALPSGQPLLSLTGPEQQAPTPSAPGYVFSATRPAFSPDGQTLAAVAHRTIQLWALPSGQPQGTLVTNWPNRARSADEPEPRIQVAFWPHGQILAAVFTDHKSEGLTVELWHWPTGWQQFVDGPPASAIIKGLTLSPDGRTMAVVGPQSSFLVLLVGVPRGHKETLFIEVVPGDTTKKIEGVAFSPDSRLIAVVSTQTSPRWEEKLAMWEVSIWEVSSGQPLPSFPMDRATPSLSILAVSPNGHTVAAAVGARTIRLWNGRTGIPAQVSSSPYVDLLDHQREVVDITFSPDNHTLANMVADGTILLWTANDRRYTRLSKTDALAAVSPDGHLYATAEGSVWLPGLPRMLKDSPSGRVQPMTSSPDGRTLVGTATAAGTDAVSLWDQHSGQRLATLAGLPSQDVHRVVFSPDGQTLAAIGTAAGTDAVSLWDSRSGQRLATIAGLPSQDVHRDGENILEMEGVIFSPDGQTLAAVFPDANAVPSPRTIGVWELPSGQRLTTLEGPSDTEISEVVFSPDGHMLAAVFPDANAVWLWTLPDGQRQSIFRLPQGFPVRFSPRGDRLAVPAEDGTIQLWDVFTGQFLASLATRNGETGAITFNPDGRLPAVTFSSDGRLLAAVFAEEPAMRTLCLWQLPAGPPAEKLLPQACLPTRDGSIGALTFSSTGSLLIDESKDAVRLWAVPMLRPLADIPLNTTTQVQTRFFRPDDDALLVIYGDGSVEVWPRLSLLHMTPEALYQQAERETGMRVEGSTVHVVGEEEAAKRSPP